MCLSAEKEDEEGNWLTQTHLFYEGCMCYIMRRSLYCLEIPGIEDS